MTRILGISAFYHDSAAALVEDGVIVAAAQEERFTRIKHDSGLPRRAIEYCLAAGNCAPEQIDYVGFYEKPFAKFDRLLQTYLAFSPAGYRSFRAALPLWLKSKLRIPAELDRAFAKRYSGSYVFTDHHESHAASAFFPSPFDEAAILTLDGVGEWSTGSYGTGRGNTVELSHEMRFPHSLGLLYSAFTYYTGFRVNSAEYKVMGLAPYGEPRYKDVILQRLVDLKEDGSFRMNMKYFNYCQGLTMTSAQFNDLFGGPPRRPESALTQKEMDLAASVQAVTEEILLRCARHVHAETSMSRLVMSGGVALNCVGAGRLLREGPFDRIWIQPASGDAGGALGAALMIWYQLLGNERRTTEDDSQRGSLLGPDYGEREIREFLDGISAPYRYFSDVGALCEHTAQRISEGDIVGWFQGRMEFGPRALGCRSILGDARGPSTQMVMNKRIKYRESFRPFAPAILEEYCGEYFDLDRPSPYMNLVAQVTGSQRRNVDDEDNLSGLDKLRVSRSSIPATTHIDYSARVQTVGSNAEPRFRRLLVEFHRLTGCPVLVNTSFNIRGEPIVCTPQDAYRCFLRTGMDLLVIGDFVLRKSDQQAIFLGIPEEARGDWAKLLATGFGNAAFDHG